MLEVAQSHKNTPSDVQATTKGRASNVLSENRPERRRRLTLAQKIGQG